MKRVIVTVKSPDGRVAIDVEVPIDMPAKALSEGMVAAINLHECGAFSLNTKYRLYVEHFSRYLEDEETFEDAGVWDGSIVALKPR